QLNPTMTAISVPSPATRSKPRLPRPVRQALSLLFLLLLIAFAWEGVKWIGGDPWRPENNPWGLEHNPPYRFKVASDLNLPHLWEIGQAFANPARRNGPPLASLLAS